MNISHLAVLLVRFFGICLAIASIYGFAYGRFIFSTNDPSSIAWLVIPGSLLLAGVLVWFFPLTLARSLTGFNGTMKEGAESILADQFASIAFLVLALYLCYRVLSDGSYWLYYYLNYENYGMSEIGIDASASLFATMIELVFLVAMIAGRKRIFKFFSKLRS